MPTAAKRSVANRSDSRSRKAPKPRPTVPEVASSLQAAIESLQANRAAMFEVMGRSRRSTDLQLKAGAVSLAKVQLSIDHLSRAVQQLEAFDGVAR